MSGSNQSRFASPEAPLFDVGDSADLDADGAEQHTEFAVGLSRQGDGGTNLRRHDEAPTPAMPPPAHRGAPSASIPKSEQETAPYQRAVQSASASPSAPVPRTPPAPPPQAPPPQAPPSPEQKRPISELQLDLSPPPAAALAGVVNAPLPDGVRTPASTPLDPEAFAPSPAKSQVESLIDEVIDEVGALDANGVGKSAAVAPPSGTSGSRIGKRDRSALQRRIRAPKPTGFSGPGRSRTEFVDGQAAAIDRAVSRAVQTGVVRLTSSASHPMRPSGGTDESAMKVVVGRPEAVEQPVLQPTAEEGSGLELAYEPAPARIQRRDRRPPDLLDKVSPGSTITRQVLIFAAIVVAALVALSVTRSLGL